MGKLPERPRLPSSAVWTALAALDPGQDPLQVQSRLRGRLAPGEARAAAALFDLQRRAAGKLPAPERLFLTRKGLEQATAWPVARFRAERLAEAAPGAAVWDATAGIGGDALALVSREAPLVASDRDPLHCLALAHNLAAAGGRPRVVRARAEERAVRAELLLLDPDRRPDGAPRGRAGDPERWSPPLSRCLALAARFAGACLKLPPGADAGLLLTPELPADPVWVSLDGELRELGLWTGVLATRAPGVRTAIVLASDGRAERLEGREEHVAALAPEEAASVAWIAEPDPAVIRAGLVGTLARALSLRPLGPAIAYLGGDARPASPFARAFRVRDTAPLDRRRVRAMLERHDVGPLVVKKRGHPDDAATLARALKGRGNEPGLLLVARLGALHRAWLVEPALAAAGRGIGPSGEDRPTDQ